MIEGFEQYSTPKGSASGFSEFEQYRTNNKPKMGYGETALAALNKGFMGLSHGITGPLMESGIFGPGVAEQSKLMGQRRNEEYRRALESHPNLAEGMMLAGAIPNAIGLGATGVRAPFIGPAARAVTSRIPQAIASNPYAQSIAKWAGGGVGAGTWGALDYPEEGETRMGNAAHAAPYGIGLGIAGSALGKAGEFAGSLINKARNAKAGNYKPAHQQVMRASEKHGVDILPADLYPNGGTIATATEVAEKIPFINITGKRKQQNAQAGEAAKNAVREQEAKMIKSSYGQEGSLANIEKVAKGDSKRAPVAKQLLEDIKNSGDDWNKIIKTSGNVSLFEKKLHSDMLSDKVTQLAKPFGNVPEIKTNNAIDDAIKEVSSQRLPDKGLLSLLKGLKEPQSYGGLGGFSQKMSPGKHNPQTLSEMPISARAKGYDPATMQESSPYPLGGITGKGATRGSAPSGKSNYDPVTLRENRGHSYGQMRAFRSQLGSMISDYYNGKNALIGEAGVGYLQSVKNAIEEDMATFAKSHSPELAKAFEEFNNYYREKLVPYKDTKLAQALKNANPDEIYKSFIKLNDIPEGQGTDRAKKFYNALDKKGQEAVKTGFLNEGLQKAMNPDTGVFSGAKFSTYLKKNQPIMSFFDESGKQEISDLQKLMRSIEKSGQMKEPETGVKWIKYALAGAMAGGAIMSPALALAAIAGTYGLKKATGSPLLAKLIAASSAATRETKSK